jgi:hypothetical protein
MRGRRPSATVGEDRSIRPEQEVRVNEPSRHRSDVRPVAASSAQQAHAAASAVVVQLNWSDWRTAMVRCADLEDIHWWQPPGAPRPLLHAYAWCHSVLSRDPLHDCDPLSAPHRLRLCILRAHVLPDTFDELMGRAAAAGPGRAGSVEPT